MTSLNESSPELLALAFAFPMWGEAMSSFSSFPDVESGAFTPSELFAFPFALLAVAASAAIRPIESYRRFDYSGSNTLDPRCRCRLGQWHALAALSLPTPGGHSSGAARPSRGVAVATVATAPLRVVVAVSSTPRSSSLATVGVRAGVD